MTSPPNRTAVCAPGADSEYGRSCCTCGGELIGVEYAYGHPGRYDGVSEWMCGSSGARRGRWSGRELVGEDYERRWGQEP